MLKLIIEKMLFTKAARIIFLIFLLYLFTFSFTLNLKKLKDDKYFDYNEELANLLQGNNTLSSLKNENENDYKINFEINKHHVKEEHLDLDAFAFNNSKLKDFNRNLEIHKEISPLSNSNLNIYNNNNTFYDTNLFNVSEGLKAIKEMEFDLPHEAEAHNSYNNKTEDKKINKNNSKVNDTNENENKAKYDYVYYPEAIGSKMNLPLRRNDFFGCKDCENNEEDQNALDLKLPNEDKWVKLEPVKFVKQISPATKAALEIENIEEYCFIFINFFFLDNNFFLILSSK